MRIFIIVDDEPAAIAVWLPEVARLLGARPPYHVSIWLGRALTGAFGVRIMTEQRGSSNAKAKRLLDWRPLYSSWREGFRRMLEHAAAA